MDSTYIDGEIETKRYIAIPKHVIEDYTDLNEEDEYDPSSRYWNSRTLAGDTLEVVTAGTKDNVLRNHLPYIIVENKSFVTPVSSAPNVEEF